MTMQRILVIGLCGAGKSHFAIQLGNILKLEVIHLDKYFWKPGWVETSKMEWLPIVENLVKKNSWIMDGNFCSTLDLRMGFADTVFFFDFPIWYCLSQIYKRVILSKLGLHKRTDMAEGCKERFDLEFTKYVLNFNRNHLPIIHSALSKFKDRNIVVFKTRKEANEYLEKLGKEKVL
jgi:adenylate kinase family enzyme